VVHHVRSIHCIDGPHPVVKAERDVLVQQVCGVVGGGGGGRLGVDGLGRGRLGGVEGFAFECVGRGVLRLVVGLGLGG
jgi:hypothetical protein